MVAIGYVSETTNPIGQTRPDWGERKRHPGPEQLMVDTTQIQIAAIVFPIIVLITNFAINSVTHEDDNRYRIFVGGMGILGLITAMIAAVLLFIGGFSELQIPIAYRFLLVSVIVIFVLALGIMIHEISRGLEADADKVYVFVGIGVFVSTAVVVMRVL